MAELEFDPHFWLSSPALCLASPSSYPASPMLCLAPPVLCLAPPTLCLASPALYWYPLKASCCESVSTGKVSLEGLVHASCCYSGISQETYTNLSFTLLNSIDLFRSFPLDWGKEQYVFMSPAYFLAHWNYIVDLHGLNELCWYRRKSFSLHLRVLLIAA